MSMEREPVDTTIDREPLQRKKSDRLPKIESIDISNPQLSPNDRIELLNIVSTPSETITEARARLLMNSVDLLGKSGQPIFVAEDIHDTTDFLAKIVRMYFVDQNITYEYFKIMHNIYCESLCMLPESINYDRNNLKRALLKPTMTKPLFEKIFSILGAHIIDVSVLILTENKQQLKYSINRDTVYIKCKEV